MIYEYIRIVYDGSLETLNSLAANGWRISTSIPCRASSGRDEHHIILERPIPLDQTEKVREFYRSGKRIT